jgi:hypothetical protein
MIVLSYQKMLLANHFCGGPPCLSKPRGPWASAPVAHMVNQALLLAQHRRGWWLQTVYWQLYREGTAVHQVAAPCRSHHQSSHTPQRMEESAKTLRQKRHALRHKRRLVNQTAWKRDHQAGQGSSPWQPHQQMINKRKSESKLEGSRQNGGNRRRENCTQQTTSSDKFRQSRKTWSSLQTSPVTWRLSMSSAFPLDMYISCP